MEVNNFIDDNDACIVAESNVCDRFTKENCNEKSTGLTPDQICTIHCVKLIFCLENYSAVSAIR